jgi:hypothetical protein
MHRDAMHCDANTSDAKQQQFTQLNIIGMKAQSFVGQISEQTGISKRSLASLTGTHQSILVRFDAGTHSLPVKALPELIKLQQALNNAEIAEAMPTPEDIASLQEQANWCIAQCFPLQKKLSAMKKAYQQAATTLALMTIYKKEDITDTKQQRWVEQQYYEANKKIAASNWAAQFKLSTEIALLQQEAGLCNTAIAAATKIN